MRSLFDTILFYIAFLGFTVSCSMGVYNDSNKLNKLGCFLFFVCWMLSYSNKKGE